jgi:heat shock protein HtpX
MTLVVILVGAIMLFADLFIHLRPRGKDNSQIAIAFLLVGLILSIISPIFAELIKLAVSRQREYLADASAALLTRYPEGLATALLKISQTNVPMKDANHATAHLFIANPFGTKKAKSFFSGIFSTHPPVEERVRRLREMGG